MNKTLYVLSGAGDPENELYAQVYNLIGKGAKERGYDRVVIQGWPGQRSYAHGGALNQTDAAAIAVALLSKADATGEPYDVICRSFGTTVFLEACRHVRLRNIGFASLWGICAYTEVYRLFVEQLDATMEYSLRKDVVLNETLFPSAIPPRILLEDFDQSFQLNLLWGSLDKYCSKGYIEFLKEANQIPNLRFQVLQGIEHEVMVDKAGYLHALFNEPVR